MAIQDKFLKGPVGNLVYYELNGRQVVRQRPRKVKMAAVSRAQASNFGHASRVSSLFTKQFKRMLELPKLPGLQQRLAGSISRWAGTVPLAELNPQYNIPYVGNFRLNTEAELDFLFKTQLQVTAIPNGNLCLSIPSFQPSAIINAPPFTTVVRCRFGAVACRLQEAELAQFAETTVDIPFISDSYPSQQFDLEVTAATGEIILVVVSVLFIGKTYEALAGRQELKWRPVEVVGAVYG